jgi:hypothetical protein
LALGFVLSVNAQSKTIEVLEKENKAFKNNKCKIEYDKFKDFTIVSSSLGGANLAFHTITATFGFDGQIFKEPVKSYIVSFTTISVMRDTTLIFIANGERVKIGEAVSRNQPAKFMGLTDIYRHTYEFTPEQLEKFASVEKIEFQIGNLDLKTQKDVSEKLKNLITLSRIK